MEKPLDIMTCAELVSLCLKKTCDAFGVLYGRYNAFVRNTCFKIVKNRDTADDLTQETFLNALDKLHQFRPIPGEKSFKKWVWGIAMNVSCNYYRRSKKLEEIRKENFEKDGIDISNELAPDKVAENNEEKNLLMKAIYELPELARTCVVGLYLLGMSYKDLYEAYHLNKHQVTHLLDIGRRILRGKLEK